MKKIILFLFSLFFFSQAYAKIEEKDLDMLTQEIIFRSYYQNNKVQKNFCNENIIYCKNNEDEIFIMDWILKKISIEQYSILIDLLRFNLSPMTEEMLKSFLVKNQNKIKYNFNVNYEELNHKCMNEMNLFLLNNRNLILEEELLINEKFKEENMETELLCKSIADIQKIVNDLKENKLTINDEVLISKEKLLKIAYENILLNNYYYELKKNISCNFYFEQYKTCFMPSADWSITFIENQTNNYINLSNLIRFQLQTALSEYYHDLIYAEKNKKIFEKIFKKINIKKLRQQCEQESLSMNKKYNFIFKNNDLFNGCMQIEEMKNEIKDFLK